MDLPLFLFKCENGKDRIEGTGGVWYLFVALIGFISLPAQDTVSPRGSTRNRTDITSNELFGGIFIKLVERVKNAGRLDLERLQVDPFDSLKEGVK